jgi:hypothetical protein
VEEEIFVDSIAGLKQDLSVTRDSVALLRKEFTTLKRNYDKLLIRPSTPPDPQQTTQRPDLQQLLDAEKQKTEKLSAQLAQIRSHLQSYYARSESWQAPPTSDGKSEAKDVVDRINKVINTRTYKSR